MSRAPFRRFWSNVRSGAGWLFPRVRSDSPRLDDKQLEERLRKAAVWLTPKTVEDFREEDFAFLDQQERRRLAESVEGFLQVAGQVPPDQRATSRQYDEALRFFLDILRILDFQRYADPDAFYIGKRLEQALQGKLPEWVRELRFETGTDAAGEPAVWIRLIVADEAAGEGMGFPQNIYQVKQTIIDTLETLDVPHWPYFVLRTETEEKELVQEPTE